MSSEHGPDDKVYQADDQKQLSMHDLLKYFLQSGSMRISDLHIKVGCPPVYRIDGVLQRMKGADMDAGTVSALLAGILDDEQMEAFKSGHTLDSSYFMEEMQFRVNCFFDMDGPAAAIRALDATALAVDRIGFANDVWRDIVTRQHGLVLLTGITGAGKSTTIAAMIDEIARTRACRIITLEDPIEYRLRSNKAIISQRQIGRDVSDFCTGLRDCLREDPDVIFVGEMRDAESATWTLTAAETGHLVFSTLHTRDVRGSITRLLDMFPDRQDEMASQLSLSLAYVICQKLVPRCDGKGRAVAMEILNNIPAVANLIRTSKLEQIYTQLQTRTKDIPAERMMTMERSLALMVGRGIISRVEAEKWANDRTSFADDMDRVDRRGRG